MIPEELQPSLQGVVPAQIVTCGEDGLPNVTVISQVYPVDEKHVAISNQFFSKTHQNLEMNPKIVIQVMNPEDLFPWKMWGKFIRRETEGELFEDMEMQLEAIASMSGMEDVFELKGADIIEITKVEKVTMAIA